MDRRRRPRRRQLAEFPEWFLAKRCYWLIFANIREKDMNHIEGSNSEVICKFMDEFWNMEGYSFERLGIQV